MRRVAAAAAVLLLAAALAGCLGSDGAGGADDPEPVSEPSASGDEGADGNGTEARDAGGGNGTAEEEAGEGNATDEGAGADGGNATDDGPRRGQVVAEGHIAVGSPTTYVRSATVLAGQEGVDSFRWEADLPAGTVLATNTTANRGGPYNVDVYFHDANGTYLGGCNAAQNGEETCEVPEGAVQGTVDAAWGADLDVVLYVQEPP